MNKLTDLRQKIRSYRTRCMKRLRGFAGPAWKKIRPYLAIYRERLRRLAWPERWIEILILVFVFIVFALLILTLFFVPKDCLEFGSFLCYSLGVEDKRDVIQSLALALAGLVSALAVLAALRRADAMNETAQAQVKTAQAQDKTAQAQDKTAQAQADVVKATEKGHRQQRFRDAVDHLGKEQVSVRQGGAYALFYLALDEDRLRASIAEILCAHIRETTSRKEYREEYANKPSAEIRSLLELLFTTKIHSEKTLKQFWKDRTPDLSEAYFRGVALHDSIRFQGADLRGTQFQGADLRGTQFQGADLRGTQFQGADLWDAQFQGAELWVAQFQGADLRRAQFQGADLRGAQFQGADLWDAQFQGAELRGAQFQGAKLQGAQFQGADLRRAQFQGADLRGAQFQGANLRGAQFQGANLQGAQFQGAYLEGAQFQGVFCDSFSFGIFENKIKSHIGEDSDLSSVVFSGGLSKEGLGRIIGNVSGYIGKERTQKERTQDLKERLQKHVGQPESYELPQDSRAVTGRYTEEEAEQWIQEYNKNRDDDKNQSPAET